MKNIFLFMSIFLLFSCTLEQDKIEIDGNYLNNKKSYNINQNLFNIQSNIQDQLNIFCLENASNPTGSIYTKRCWNIMPENNNSYSWFGNLDNAVYSIIENSVCNNGSYVPASTDDVFSISTFFIDYEPYLNLNYNMSYFQVNNMIIDFQTKLKLAKDLVSEHYTNYDNVEIYTSNIDIYSTAFLCCQARYLYFNFNLCVNAFNN